MKQLTHDETISPQLRAIAGEMSREGNQEQAGKLRELADKMRDNRLHVAMCGHFSAGKSSLVNKLCGADLLPAGPVPTSANLVTIADGEPGVLLHERTGETRRLKAELAGGIPDWHQACEDGAAVRHVEIRYPLPLLGPDLVLVDTPGVDSTDDLHRKATEDAIHLADVVCYVMDYNHVLSENNFRFAKHLADLGKPIYAVVNQIDKHREFEVPFREFRETVSRAFRDWHIPLAGILFVSVRVPQARHNEWERMLGLFGALRERAGELAARATGRAAEAVIREFGGWLARRSSAEKERLIGESERLAGTEPDAEASGWLEEAERLRALDERVAQELRSAASGIVEHAHIVPATTRGLAHRYLQSRKPGFKVGLLFAGDKTKQERERRLAAFRDDLRQKVNANLLWHLQDLLKKTLRPYGWLEEEAAAAAERVTLEVDAGWLAELVGDQPVFSDEYTLVYANKVAEAVKNAARRALLEAAEQACAERRPATERRLAELEDRLAGLREAERLRGRAADMEQAERSRVEELLAMLAPWPAEAAAWPDPADVAPEGAQRSGAADAAADGSTAGGGQARPEAAPISLAEAASPQDADPAVSGNAWEGADAVQRLRRKAGQLEQAAQLIAERPGFERTALALRERAELLRKSRFTIALFGAFSAGKSSFANALLGEPVLPVSPNPTTAAINRIVPPERPEQHGTATVRMKSPQAIRDDIRFSLEALGLEAKVPDGGDMEPVFRTIRAVDPANVPPIGKPHLAFLRAVEQGWAEAAPTLGGAIDVDMENFRRHVAEESRSAFVETIELAYACPLTDAGVVLVDTPGADSINARHTGVAFNYIKNADAVLFVTYYNHAFSQADRDFLRQLGRVKDSFAMDKMFFLVNAADLAASSDELAEVVGHVRDNLAAFQIREPKLYPVSSRIALEGRLHGDAEKSAQSGIRRFERDFIAFTRSELAELAVRQAQAELAAVAERLDRLEEEARLEKGERERKRVRCRDALRQAEEWLERDAEEKPPEAKELEREASELFYHVKQRQLYRFGEWYNLAFHPSVLSGGGDVRTRLRTAWHELVRLLAAELSNEALATSLRLDAKLRQLLLAWSGRASERIGELHPDLPPVRAEWPDRLPTPAVRETVDGSGLDPAVLSRYFKNARQFFEEGGKEKLRGELERICGELAGAYVDEHEAMFRVHYAEWLEQICRAAGSGFAAAARAELEASGLADDAGQFTNLIRDLRERLSEIMMQG